MLKLLTIFIFSFLFCTQSFSTPLKEITFLPLTKEDIDKIKHDLNYDEKKIEKLLALLLRLKVYSDHTNPKNEKINDKSIKKTYWLAPFFSPAEDEEISGTLYVALSSLEVVAEIDSLSRAMNVDLKRVSDLSESLTKLEQKSAEISLKMLEEGNSSKLWDNYSKIKESINEDIEKLKKQIEAIKNESGYECSKVEKKWRNKIFSAIITETSRLGLSPTTEEINLMNNDDGIMAFNGLAKFRSRIANSQFAIQQVLLLSGLRENERKLLNYYFKVREDIEIKQIATNKVYARAAVETLMNKKENKIATEIRAINSGYEDGSCGGSDSCNIILEFTENGAKTIARATAGSVLLPVWFEAEVSFMEPAFKGEIDCSFSTGFSAKGRADIKDGAFIYDGDLTDNIDFESISSGNGCKVKLAQGSSKDDAFYYILQDLYSQMESMRITRMHKSKQEKDLYASELQRRLETSRNDAEKNTNRQERTIFSSYLTAFSNFNVASFVISEARGFYWHTTKLDKENVDFVNFKSSFDLEEAQKKQFIAFDGYPVVCWKKSHNPSALPVPSACGSSQDLKPKEVNTIKGSAQRNCQEENIRKCIESIRNDFPTNSEGDIISAL